MDKKYIVKVVDTSDETTLTLLDFGTVDYISQITNIGSIIMDSKNVSKLRGGNFIYGSKGYQKECCKTNARQCI